EASPPSGNDFVAIAAGGYHGLALKADGAIAGWGENDYGEASPPSGNDVVAVAAGEAHSLALKGMLVPDVVGMTQAEAESAIVAAGLVVGNITQAYSDTLPAGNVICQEPVAGGTVNFGSAVNLLISIGPLDVGEPNLPFDAEFMIVNKSRVGRTIFDYDCNVSLKNTSPLNVRVLQFELVTVPNNISVTDSYVNDFEDIGPGETKTSADTCTFRVERSEPINFAQVTWKVTYEIINACSPLQQMSYSMVNFEPQDIGNADITGDGKVDHSDLAVMAEQWLQPPGSPSADIASAPGGEGIVNFLDFAALAENWLVSTNN
ncbi:MAG: PASTA domain-containing protein, partial [Candidatus Brocadiia bacterium]